MNTALAVLICLVMTCSLCAARTLRVPVEFETIQGALNALLANDTVLVDTGLYVEELTAPALSFVVIGNISADTSDHARPIIDPAGLANPGGRGCLSLSSGNVRIENFVFRNGTAMHPHWTGDVGGIHVLGSMNLSLTNCRFDSVYYGIFAHGDIASIVNLEWCEFVHAMGRCVFAATIIAEHCSFHTDTVDWAQLTFGDYSSIVNCSFSGNFRGGNVLLCSGKHVTITGCRFSNFVFAPASSSVVLRVGASEVSNNVFSDYQKGQSVLQVSPPCDAEPNVISGNRFENLTTPESHAFLTAQCLGFGAADNPDSCATIQVYDNVFINCSSTIGPVGISTAMNCNIAYNRFIGMHVPNRPVVSIDDIPHLFRENIFQGNGIAVAPGSIHGMVHAEWNYWGDATGPYHPVLNPTALGDTVADSVDFDPWFSDTLFWSSAEEETDLLSSTWQLRAIYPNPFNSEFRIELDGMTGADFEVRLFDLLGREVALLHSGRTLRGALNFAAPANLAAGIYFISAHDRFYSETKKVLYLK